eukprot:6338532-Amphidinium_carterae.4
MQEPWHIKTMATLPAPLNTLQKTMRKERHVNEDQLHKNTRQDIGVKMTKALKNSTDKKKEE